MTTERIIDPNTFVHPTQTYLWKRLHSQSLPEGAAELITEAIKEYQSIFITPWRRDDNRRIIETGFTMEIPDDSPGTILAGRSHLLTLKFGRKGEIDDQIGEIYTHLVVVLGLRNMPGVEVYPDRLIYIAIDNNGRSKPTQFLLAVPNSLQGYRTRVELRVFNNGGVLCAHQGLDLKLA